MKASEHERRELALLQRDMKARRTEAKPFKHAGGGCEINSSKSHPCDDLYQGPDGTEIEVNTSYEAHFKMPALVSGATELRRLKGVAQVRIRRRR